MLQDMEVKNIRTINTQLGMCKQLRTDYLYVITSRGICQMFDDCC